MIPTVTNQQGHYWIMSDCVFCRGRTYKIHINTNNPVCDACKKTHRAGELTDWRGMAKTKSRL